LAEIVAVVREDVQLSEIVVSDNGHRVLITED
jgi:hypothetical protein